MPPTRQATSASSAAAAQYRVHGPDDDWFADHAAVGLLGPARLTLGDDSLLTDCHFGLDDLTDAQALAESPRLSHPGGIATVRQSGHFPFGANPQVGTTLRYIDGLARYTTDVTLPRGQVVRQQIQLANLTLPGAWASLRYLDRHQHWQTVDLATATGDILRLPEIPGAMVFARPAGGPELEIGLGSDLWRWRQGFGGEANVAELLLSTGNGCLKLTQTVSRFAEEATPEPRIYRFSGYFAWRRSGTPVAASSAVAPLLALWRDNGDLALRHLGELQPDQPLLIDLHDMPWPDPLRRGGIAGAPPCLAAPGVVKRLKRVMRQIHGLERQDFPIHFRHLGPAPCSLASHIDRKGERLHSDIGGLMDFATWTRSLFGPERDLQVDAADIDRPAMAVLFNRGLSV